MFFIYISHIYISIHEFSNLIINTKYFYLPFSFIKIPVDTNIVNSADVGNIQEQLKLPINTTSESYDSFIGTGPVDTKKPNLNKPGESDSSVMMMSQYSIDNDTANAVASNTIDNQEVIVIDGRYIKWVSLS